MKIVYLSNACSEEMYARFVSGKKIPSPAAQKYHSLQIMGLRQAGCEVTALCIPPVSRGTYKGLFFRPEIQGQWDRCASVINVPVLRNLWMFLYVFFFTLRRTGGGKAEAVICDVLNVTVSFAALLAGFFTRTQVVGIVTDVPTKRAFSEGRSLKKLLSKLSFWLLGHFDKYIFLTQAMNELINPKGRPYLISEGHVDSRLGELTDVLSEKYPKKVCLYAGSLRRIYGIPYLVEGFLQAGVKDAELHIYGEGEYEEELRELCKGHPTLRFFGLLPNEQVVEAERKASLLINPRPTGEEYTKFSFPSKNMEYMASGTPLLTTCLPGMPREYEQYVYLLREETSEAMARELRKLLGKTPEELFYFGQKAKAFVLAEKNNIKQAQRICGLLADS